MMPNVKDLVYKYENRSRQDQCRVAGERKLFTQSHGDLLNIGSSKVHNGRPDKDNHREKSFHSTKSLSCATSQKELNITEYHVFSNSIFREKRQENSYLSSSVSQKYERFTPKPTPKATILTTKLQSAEIKHSSDTNNFSENGKTSLLKSSKPSKDESSVSETCHTDQKQTFGSIKNIAFLVGDTSLNSNTTGETLLQKTNRQKQSESMGCWNPTNRPKSLLYDESGKDPSSVAAAARSIRQKSASTSFKPSQDQRPSPLEIRLEHTRAKSEATSFTSSGIYSESNLALSSNEPEAKHAVQNIDNDIEISQRFVQQDVKGYAKDDTYCKGRRYEQQAHSMNRYTEQQTHLRDNHIEQRVQNTKHYVDHQARYIEETCANQPLNSNMKYPSEPNFTKDSFFSGRRLTQENIDMRGNFIKIKDSNVSINNGHSESLAASQFSVFSSEQETRQAIAEQTKEFLECHKNGPQVPELRRQKRAKKVLREEGVVIIVGERGSGTTHLAWDLLLADDSKEKFNVLDLCRLETCYNRSKGSAIILADDIIDETKTDESIVDRCLKYIKFSRTNKSTRFIKLIFTVKHHIFKNFKQKFNDCKKCIVDLESKNLQLDSSEMTDIMAVMIETNKERCRVLLDKQPALSTQKATRKGWTHFSDPFLSQVAENSLSSGFPKRFQQYLETNSKSKLGLAIFTRPTAELLEEILNMKQSKDQTDLDQNLTLVLTMVSGGKLTQEKIKSINKYKFQTTTTASKKKKKSKKKSHNEEEQQNIASPWWIEIVHKYSNHCNSSLLESAVAGLTTAKGKYLKEDMKGVFSFAAPCVKNAVLISLGQDFPHHILKLCDTPFFLEYVGSNSCFMKDEDCCVRINVQNEVICSEANKFLIQIADQRDIESFSKHRLLSNERFLQQFLESFRKDPDQLWDLGRKSDMTSGRCSISCALDTASLPLHFQNAGNFAYCLLLHKVWGQKRKCHKEWSAQMEKDVIQHCCKQRHEDIYFELRRKYNIPVDYICLRAAVAGGSFAIVDDILQSTGKDMSDTEKCRCMELALTKYTGSPLKSRHEVVNALLKFVSVDYKISGIEPVIQLATKSGDARIFVTLDVFDGDINITNFEGKTCLHEAVKRNKAAFLQIALSHGADQWKSDRSGILPIHVAAMENKSYIMRLLIDNDVNVVEATDRSGRQPLHYAAMYGSFEAANVLLECSVEVDMYDDDNNTPLHYAAASGTANVIHRLLEAHADKNKTDRNGDSPLLIACKVGNTKGVKRLLRDIRQTEVYARPNECLFASVEHNQSKILEMLVDKGFNVNKENKDGKTLLCFAIEMNAGLVNYMIKSKVDVNMPSEGNFPLHVAAANGREEVFQSLVEAGANIEEVTLENKDSVLHITIANGHDSLTDHILKTDSLIGCRNRDGETPLHVAVRRGNLQVVESLLRSGAERSPINKHFQTPLCLVEKNLEELKGQTQTDNYSNLYTIKMLLMGHKGMLETAL